MSYLSYDNIYRTSPSNQLKLEICSRITIPADQRASSFKLTLQSRFAKRQLASSSGKMSLGRTVNWTNLKMHESAMKDLSSS